ncbi:hypothetical protein NDU88_002967 [Pleurodeles waltl]|uniref:Uncharacterized protein n=1 Tax=Pleurodeles waltl TaxID=8319 RepID=A0AAV7UAS1_PLEWA|nr:hypothetical protein NDU88_002967 [Pleurodeles waltl]
MVSGSGRGPRWRDPSPRHETNVIQQIRDDTGRVWIDAGSVVGQFRDYYTDLCKSCLLFDEAAVTDNLIHMVMPWLMDDH